MLPVLGLSRERPTPSGSVHWSDAPPADLRGVMTGPPPLLLVGLVPRDSCSRPAALPSLLAVFQCGGRILLRAGVPVPPIGGGGPSLGSSSPTPPPPLLPPPYASRPWGADTDRMAGVWCPCDGKYPALGGGGLISGGGNEPPPLPPVGVPDRPTVGSRCLNRSCGDGGGPRPPCSPPLDGNAVSGPGPRSGGDWWAGGGAAGPVAAAP